MGQTPHPFASRARVPWLPHAPQQRRIAAQVDSGEGASASIGGIGAGTIGRAMDGGFHRWTLKAGQLFTFEMPENGFAFWHEGHGARALRAAAPAGWCADPAGEHAALYPKAWHSYRSGDLALCIEQIAPVVPEIGADVDLPVGLFRVHLENHGAQAECCSVLFSFANLCGMFQDFNGPGQPGGVAGQHNRLARHEEALSVVMGQDIPGAPDEGQGSMALSARPAAGVTLSAAAAFDPVREGAAFWEGFAATGEARACGPEWTSGGGFSEFPAATPCAAIAAKTRLEPGECRTIDFALAWDFPVIRFGQGRRHARHYTSRWGCAGTNAEALARHALRHAPDWSAKLDQFHETQAARLDLPPEACALALNELYFIADGLTVWTAPDEAGREHFGVIECPDYPLYNTLDLWVYAASAFADLYPDLARLVTGAYAEELTKADEQVRFHLRSNDRYPRQRAGMMPHDLGAPNADPFLRANDYTYQDSSQWKDLNAMFVICAWRDIRRDPGLAAALHAPVTQAMAALRGFDRDGDGLIENDGTPDQTFDNIPMTGISAYCGGLWLAALRAAAEIARMAGDTAQQAEWQAMSQSGEPAFEAALWNGRYFRLDSGGAFREALFAEQLYGPATARMLGLGDVVDPQKARAALREIFARNYAEAGGGRGVVAITSPAHSSSLYAPKGEEGLQWDEILTGFNYSFAAALRTYGLEEECRQLLISLAQELGPQRGLNFRSPAALVPDRPEIRAQMNMRPLGIWALVEAAAYLKGYIQTR